MSFYLPGDVIGRVHHAMSVASATVIALTECVLCTAPAAPAGSSLEQAYAIGEALDEAYLLGHIVQLGRLNAQERIGAMHQFIGTLTDWYSQVRGLKKTTLISLMKLGAKVARFIPGSKDHP